MSTCHLLSKHQLVKINKSVTMFFFTLHYQKWKIILDSKSKRSAEGQKYQTKMVHHYFVFLEKTLSVLKLNWLNDGSNQQLRTILHLRRKFWSDTFDSQSDSILFIPCRQNESVIFCLWDANKNTVSDCFNFTYGRLGG